ncbi:MAG: hypothetical protein HYZ14_06295 [Bacteroidetes bacterium]|nr:hypothetical protein [Bacteroidota bacterium]
MRKIIIAYSLILLTACQSSVPEVDLWIESQLTQDSGLVVIRDTLDDRYVYVRFLKDHLPFGQTRTYDFEGSLTMKGIHFSGEDNGYEYIYDSLNRLILINGYSHEAPERSYLQEYVEYGSDGSLNMEKTFYVDLAFKKFDPNNGLIHINPIGQAADADSLELFLDFFQGKRHVLKDSLFVPCGSVDYDLNGNMSWDRLIVRILLVKIMAQGDQVYNVKREVYRVLNLHNNASNW